MLALKCHCLGCCHTCTSTHLSVDLSTLLDYPVPLLSPLLPQTASSWSPPSHLSRPFRNTHLHLPWSSSPSFPSRPHKRQSWPMDLAGRALWNWWVSLLAKRVSRRLLGKNKQCHSLGQVLRVLPKGQGAKREVLSLKDRQSQDWPEGPDRIPLKGQYFGLKKKKSFVLRSKFKDLEI